MTPGLTKAERLLLAGAHLEERGERPFSAEDLVVEAWTRYPDVFALEGYPEYPDSNRVYAEVMGSKALRSRGWMVKVGEKRYQLSEAGRLVAEGLGWAAPAEGPSRADLSRSRKIIVARLLSSRAAEKARMDSTDAIVFADACGFWDISPRSDAKTLEARLKTVEGVLTAAEAVVANKGALQLTQARLAVAAKDLQLLRDTHNLLLERFAEELELIRRRRDERSHR